MYELLETMRQILLLTSKIDVVAMPGFVFAQKLPAVDSDAIWAAVDELAKDGLISVCRDDHGHALEVCIMPAGRNVAVVAERNENWRHFIEEAGYFSDNLHLSQMVAWQRQDLWVPDEPSERHRR